MAHCICWLAKTYRVGVKEASVNEKRQFDATILEPRADEIKSHTSIVLINLRQNLCASFAYRKRGI